MLSAVRSNRGARLFGGLIATCALVAGCSSTTNGAGQVASRPPTPPSSEPGFPSTPPPETTTAPSTSAPSAPTGTSQPAPPQPLRTVSVTGADGKTYVIKIWADVKNRTCFDHAYGGPIVKFLTRHPCTGLERYLATTTVNGRSVGLAESATGFPGTAKDPYRWASRFATLEKANGTGSLNDLLREGYRLPSGPTSIPRSEAFNVISQDQGVTVWDAWYLDGPTPTNDPALIRMTQDAFLQF
jgi:hypothetical protein